MKVASLFRQALFITSLFVGFESFAGASAEEVQPALVEQRMHHAFSFGKQMPNEQAAASLQQAQEDFQAVIAGGSPKFARFDEEHPLPADGGTSYYIGTGYKLTIIKAMTLAGHVSGYLYGPVITFDDDILSGNYKEISHVTFYANEAMRELLKKR